MANPGEAAPDRALADAEAWANTVAGQLRSSKLGRLLDEYDRRGVVEKAATALVREWERIEDEYDNWRLEGSLVALAEALGRDPGADTTKETGDGR